MKCAGLDGYVDDVAVLDPGARAEATHHDRLVLALRCRGLDGALLADVACQLTHVLGQRGRRVDREVRDDLRAERLTEHHDPAQPLVFGDVGRECRVLEVLGADADDEPLADVPLELASVGDELVAQRELVLADLHREPAVRARRSSPPPCSSRGSR